MRRKIDGLVIIITGASAGIGLALAEELSKRGAKLVLAARRLDRLEQLNASLGGGHLCVQADVSDPTQCRSLIDQAIARFGRIDVLVCNAGYGIVRTIAETTHDQMSDIFRTNVLGTTDCISAAVPVMRSRELRDGLRGQIVIVSSAAARRGLPYFGAYSATKAAQLSIAEALRVELRPHGIAVSSIHPIGTDTDFFTTAESLSGAKIPPRRAAELHQTPGRVAEAIARSIERPRPEVWPFRPMRWLTSFATLFPRVADRVMAGHRKALADRNG